MTHIIKQLAFKYSMTVMFQLITPNIKIQEVKGLYWKTISHLHCMPLYLWFNDSII